ncbi:MAG: hypothetical protein FWF53_11185 [Candidatus Azobacteroides sp.]|nr:hypothetical protein [Candidatus Azobacteroides sp.]
MIFIIIVIFAIGLYIRGHKTSALVIFFFLLTSGFNLIPEELMDIGVISKGGDFAFLILIGIVLIDSFCVKNYLKRDWFIVLLFLFAVVLIACIVWSKWIIGGLTWSEIIRCCRYQFFWIAYLVFRNMEKTQLERLLKYLFNITAFISVLYLAQIIFHQTILNEAEVTREKLFGIRIPRYYNQPDLIQFCTLMAIFNNPHRGMWKIVTTTLLIMALLGAFHRSLFGLFLVSLLVGFILQLPRLKQIQFLSVLSMVLIGCVFFAGIRFMSSRTFSDLQYIRKGMYSEVEELDPEDFQKSTFTFRLAVLYERNQYLWDNPKKLLLGGGLISEDSPKTNTLDFKVGLLDEVKGRPTQVDCGDISYPSMIFRLGYLGTAMYLTLLIYLFVYSYKKRNYKYGLVTFLFWIMSFGVSFFSSNLLSPATYLLPLITYFIIQKTEQEKDSPDICLTI